MKKLNLFGLLILFIGIGLNACNDICKDVNCLNGGTCVDGDCECPEGFTGPHCETEIDPCLNVYCQNGGTCNDGTCDCPSGYTGINCSQVSPEQYLGIYSVAYDCSNTADFSGTSSITNDIIDSQVIISNFGGYAFSLTATINGNNITIPSQTALHQGVAFTFEGSGTMSGNVITIDYTVVNNTETDVCTATYTKQ